MADVLRLLVVEDSEDDTILVLRKLEEGGFKARHRRVESREGLRSALREQDWDVVLCDFVLPGFSGMEALKMVKEHNAHLPFLMISDKMEEEIIVETLKAGAQDYVMKDRLFRLCPAINKALRSWDNYKERKKAESELQQVVSRYYLLAENITDIIWTSDLDRKLTFVSPSITSVLGYRIEEVRGKKLENLLDAQDSRKVVDIFEEAVIRLKNHGKLPDRIKDVFEMKIRNKKRSLVWMETKFVILRDEKGQLSGILGVSRDITERKHKDEEMVLLAEAIRQVGEGVVITDHKGTVQFVNHSFLTNCGFSETEFVGKHLSLLDSGSDPRHSHRGLGFALKKGISWKDKLSRDKKDGTNFQAAVSLYPITGEGGSIANFVYVESDITHELELQEKFIEMQKMEALGTLSGGIAHDFNNILMPIIVNSEMLLWDADKDDPKNEYLNQILEASRRGKELVKQIISFSRESSVEKKIIDLVPVVTETLSFLHSSIPTTVKIDSQIDIDEGRIKGSTTQIQQVLINLCANATDAMGARGGRIKISLARADFEIEKVLPDTSLKTGPFVRLSVSDSGPGIKPDIMSMLFDPFFTTKDPGKGSGMGLSVARRIVAEHEGTIAVESELDKGATFHVYLPLSDGKLTPEEKVPGTLSGGDERILLVDDEALLVESIRNMLQRMGYRVTAVTSSKEALDLFKDHSEKIDLVVSDQTMPGLMGVDLLREISRIRPGIPLILMTGFSEETSENKAENLGIDAFLMKPVSARAMASTVRKVLDGKK
jgi:PAS domain S-box-containing protein